MYGGALPKGLYTGEVLTAPPSKITAAIQARNKAIARMEAEKHALSLLREQAIKEREAAGVRVGKRGKKGLTAEDFKTSSERTKVAHRSMLGKAYEI